MTTRHCLRYSFNLCPKQPKGFEGTRSAEPMTLTDGKETLQLRFDCKSCVMLVVGQAKRRVLKSPPPGSR